MELVSHDKENVIIKMSSGEFFKIRRAVSYVDELYDFLDSVLLEMTSDEAHKLSESLYGVLEKKLRDHGWDGLIRR